MSLLQEALRKLQKQERIRRGSLAGGLQEEGAPSPFPGAPAAAPPPPAPSRPGRRTLWLALGAAALTLSAAGVVVYVALPSKSTLRAVERHPSPAEPSSAPSAQADSAAASVPPAAGADNAAGLPEAPVAAPAPAAMPAPAPPVPAARAVVVRSSPRGKAPRAARAASVPAAAALPPPPAAPPDPAPSAPPPAPAAAAAAPAPVPQPAAEPPAPAVPARFDLVGRFNEGVSAQARSDWAAAEDAFAEVVAREPARVEGWNGLGVARMRLGKTTDAKAAFGKAVALDPAYAPALLNSGLLAMAVEGKPAEAERHFARAAAADPSLPAAWVNLAISQSRQSRPDDAEATLAAARRRFPDDPDVLYHLGNVLERSGERARAGEAYSAFLRAARGTRPALEAPVRDRLRAWGAAAK